MKIVLRFFICLITLLFISNPLFSQVDKGFKSMENGAFENAETQFRNDIEDKSLSSIAYYGLASIYSDKTNSNYDLEKAWSNWLIFNEKFKLLSEKKRNKYKKSFKIRSSKIKNQITNDAIAKAKKENSLKSYNQFLETYSKAKASQKKEIIILRNQLAYDKAIAENSPKAFQELLKSYHKDLKSKSPTLFKESQKRLFETSMKENGWNSYDDFAGKNPKNPYVKDASGQIYKSIHNLKDGELYRDFLDNHPKSLHAHFAKNQLAKLLIQKGTIAEFNWFLLSYPEHELANELWRNFFYLYKGENGERSIPQFAETYPQYPFKADLENRIKAIQRQDLTDAFNQVNNSTNVYKLLQFLEKYGNSNFAPTIDEQIVDLLFDSPTISNLEGYLTLNPETGLQDSIIKELFQLYKVDLSTRELKKFKKLYGNQFKDQNELKETIALSEDWQNLKMSGFNDESEMGYDEFIKKTAPAQPAFFALRKMILDDLKSKNWLAAKSKMNNYKSYFKDQSLPFNQLFNLLNRPTKSVWINKLNANINTSGSEYAPIISADGQTLYFCAKNREDNLGKEDIFISKLESNEWSPARLLQGINTIPSNEAPEAVSVDGTQMLMFKNGKLAFSNQTKDGWSKMDYLSKNINATKWQADASLSSDGKALLFISQRKNLIGYPIYGNYDIYVCLKNIEGEWDEVINLGSTINTPYIERSPFLHPDMKTLYFSSAGHGGLGELDVFKTTRLDDTWTNWSTPVNLGKEINTTNSDWGYKVSTDGKTAYFSYAPEGSKSEDIYQVELPKEMRPLAVSTISGILNDSDGNPLDAEIIIEDLVSRNIVAELRSNPQTGEFFVVLPDNRKYSYYIKKEGYFPIANNIDLTNDRVVTINENLKLFTVAELTEKGLNITLENIFFDSDKFDLKSESFAELDRVSDIVISNNFKVELYGHTDSDGNDNYNLDLSQNRADSVRDYLIRKGISQEDISAKGFGESQPIDSNTTIKGKAKNRRVEVRFLRSEK